LSRLSDLALKLAKSANISKQILYNQYGYHKTQNSMLCSNPSKKVEKSSPRKVIGGKLLHTVFKSKKLNFSFTLLLTTFLARVFFATFSTDSKSESKSAFSDTHIAFKKSY
jgi:hypothetical protein